MDSTISQANSKITDLAKQYESYWTASSPYSGLLGNDNRDASELYASYLLNLFPEAQSVVDVGCGAGIFLRAFKRRSLKVMGYDAHFPHDVLSPEEFRAWDLRESLPHTSRGGGGIRHATFP